MERFSVGWRNLAGLVAACVFVVFASGPGLDAMAHHMHHGVEVFGHSHAGGDLDLDHDHHHGLIDEDHDHDHGVLDHDHGLTDQHQDHDQDSGGRSEAPKFHTHGLAHQAFSAAVEAPMVVATARVERQDYGLPVGAVAVSNRHFKLIRPPRV